MDSHKLYSHFSCLQMMVNAKQTMKQSLSCSTFKMNVSTHSPHFKFRSFDPRKTRETYQNETHRGFEWQERYMLEMKNTLTFQLSRYSWRVKCLTGGLILWMETNKNRAHSNKTDRNTKYLTACLTEQIHIYASIRVTEKPKRCDGISGPDVKVCMSCCKS